jgi:hypothetical protein
MAMLQMGKGAAGDEVHCLLFLAQAGVEVEHVPFQDRRIEAEQGIRRLVPAGGVEAVGLEDVRAD